MCVSVSGIHRTAVKDRIVAFLLFLGKIFIVCVIGELPTEILGFFITYSFDQAE